jgi:hypothetical protein
VGKVALDTLHAARLAAEVKLLRDLARPLADDGREVEVGIEAADDVSDGLEVLKVLEKAVGHLGVLDLDDNVLATKEPCLVHLCNGGAGDRTGLHALKDGVKRLAKLMLDLCFDLAKGARRKRILH